MFITFFIVLSICYWTFFYNEQFESESERQTLLASIEQLRLRSHRRELRKTLEEKI